MDDDPDDGAVLDVLDRPDDLRLRALAIDDDPAPEPIQHRGRRVAVEQRLVLLVDLVARMHDAVGDKPIVRQQQQPLGLAVKPPDRHDALAHLDEIHHGVATSLVRHRRDVTLGLVEHDITQALAGDDLPVNLDLLARWVDPGTELGDHLAIDAHPPFDDQLLGATSRRYPRGRQDAL